LNLKQSIEEKVFKDPIHGFIRVTSFLIWQLIATNEFQRLRRIKQLGGTHIVYPTAEHSRFSHSLGVYHIAFRMIEELKKQQVLFTDEEEMLILCAALLHDVGHGPYSHSFESILKIDHEDFTRKILTQDTFVNRLLESYKIDFSNEVANVIEKTHPNKLIVSLISSQLDADRLDYLLRDSYFTGTPYGEVDLERILRTMRVKNSKIVFKQSGMHALEDYLFSRYQMYWQVYLHDKSISFNFVIEALLSRVRFLLHTNYKFNMKMTHFEAIFSDEINLSAYLKMDDGVITTYAQFFIEEKDSILSDLARRFLHRHLFDEFDIVTNDESEILLEKLKSLLESVQIESQYYLHLLNYKQSTYDYYGFDGEVLLEIVLPSGTICELSTVSNIIKGIVNAPKTKNTLFLPLDIVCGSVVGDEVLAILERLSGRVVSLV